MSETGKPNRILAALGIADKAYGAYGLGLVAMSAIGTFVGLHFGQFSLSWWDALLFASLTGGVLFPITLFALAAYIRAKNQRRRVQPDEHLGHNCYSLGDALKEFVAGQRQDEFDFLYNTILQRSVELRDLRIASLPQKTRNELRDNARVEAEFFQEVGAILRTGNTKAARSYAGQFIARLPK